MPEIGLMGGSFNPIHCGHVALARAALESGRVERVLFLPTGNPPHKKGWPIQVRQAAHGGTGRGT
ncbi:MAG: nicotinate-nicotinamide nucleotide adenylyltransferase [Christensenellales bacterium]